MTASLDHQTKSQTYPITVRGQVVHGDQRGRVIGFPTANVLPREGKFPDFGVYAGRLDGMPAAISIGVRPTFGSDLQPMLEAHVIGFHGDLYDREVTVVLIERIRDEIKFDSAEKLVAQIQDDLQGISTVLSTAPVESGQRDQSSLG